MAMLGKTAERVKNLVVFFLIRCRQVTRDSLGQEWIFRDLCSVIITFLAPGYNLTSLQFSDARELSLGQPPNSALLHLVIPAATCKHEEHHACKHYQHPAGNHPGSAVHAFPQYYRLWIPILSFNHAAVNPHADVHILHSAAQCWFLDSALMAHRWIIVTTHVMLGWIGRKEVTT